jgi:hypothetical protein
MIPADTEYRIGKAIALVVAGRLTAGQCAAQIRRAVSKGAADAVADVVRGPWDQEAVMAEINRGIEKALVR